MAAYPAPDPCQLPCRNIFAPVAVHPGLGVPFLVAEVPIGSVSQPLVAPTNRPPAADELPHEIGGLPVLGALQTGARRGELAALTWADVDMKARALTFRYTKNGHARTVPMTDTLREALAALPRPLSPGATVFPVREPAVLTRSFARLVRDLELQDLRFHDLRHDAASALTTAGVAQRAVMEILGHRDPRMTMRYQHLSPGHLRDAMRAFDQAMKDQPTEANKAGVTSPGGA